MGNNPSGPRLLGNGNYSYDIKLGKAATISVTRRDICSWRCWKLVYNVDGIDSILTITDVKSGDDTLVINVYDGRPVKFPIGPFLSEIIQAEVTREKATGLLYPRLYYNNNRYGEPLSGGVKGYACGTRKGLFVMESKKKSNEEHPYMVTVAHYYVNIGSGGSDVDIGFSVVVKIGVVNGQLDFIVDGPVEHPTSALVYMIEEVVGTGKWKPSACPHCNNFQSNKHRWVSDSEDSDTNLPTPPSHGGKQKVSNLGRYNGDGIGNIIQAKEVNFNKWWMMRRFRN